MLPFRRAQPNFESLVRAHQRAVIGIARNLTLDAAVADEIAQDVFCELHRELPRLGDEAHVLAWLRRVTCHRAIDHVRRRRVFQRAVEHAPPEEESRELMTDIMLNERLRRLVASLPDSMRQVVVLRYQEDLGPEAIAQTLGMPVNTVKSHLQRGLDILRGKVERIDSPTLRGQP